MPKAISSELLRKRKQYQQQKKLNEPKKKKTNYTTYCSVPGNEIKLSLEKFCQQENSPLDNFFILILPGCGLIDSKVGTFTIPKKTHMKAHWFNFLQGCGKKIDPKRKTYKICERHFEAKFVMANGTRKNIMFGGKPTLDAKMMVRILYIL